MHMPDSFQCLRIICKGRRVAIDIKCMDHLTDQWHISKAGLSEIYK